MKQISKVSIIIPHHNNYRILLDCIKSINQSTFNDFEIIIVDNASSDSSIAKIIDKYPALNIIESSKNLGYAGGCNLGAKHSLAEYLFFLNNDTIIEPDCIEKLLNRFSNKLRQGIH